MGSGEESVDHFALRYRGCGLVGLLACLLICGRQLHAFIFRHRRISALGVGCPPTMVGGFLGLGCLIILKEWFGYDWAVDKVRLPGSTVLPLLKRLSTLVTRALFFLGILSAPTRRETSCTK
jgi:hypothetical protein